MKTNPLKKIILTVCFCIFQFQICFATIPDSYGKSASNYFSEYNNYVYDTLHSFVSRNDGFNFLLAATAVLTLPSSYALFQTGAYKMAATTLLGGALSPLVHTYNASEKTLLMASLAWNPLNYLNNEEPPQVYHLDDEDHLISNAIADIHFAIPSAARKNSAWLYNNAAWYWDTTFKGVDNLHIASLLSNGLPYVDIKPAQQGWGHYIYNGLFGDGADKARNWVQTFKTLSQSIPEQKVLRIFFSRSLLNGLNLQALLIEKDDSGNIIDSSPGLSIKMEWPDNSYSILDELVAGGYGKDYGQESGEKHGEGYTVVSVFDELIMKRLTDVIRQYSENPDLTEFEFDDEADFLLPVVALPKRFNLMGLSLARGVWIFDDNRFPDQPDTRTFFISFAKENHWVVTPSKTAEDQLADEKLRDNDFNEQIVKRANRHITYNKNRDSEDWRELAWLASFKLARVADPLTALVKTVIPASTLMYCLSLSYKYVPFGAKASL